MSWFESKISLMVALSGALFRKIGLRDFQRSMYSHIRHSIESPLILTKNGKPTYAVLSYKEFEKLMLSSNVNPDVNKVNPIVDIPDTNVNEKSNFWSKAWKVLNKKIF